MILGIGADGVDLKTVSHGFPAVSGADTVAQFQQIGRFNLDLTTRLHADHHVARLSPEDELVVRLARVEQGLGDDSGFL